MAKLERRLMNLESLQQREMMVVVVDGQEANQVALDRLDPTCEIRKHTKKILFVTTGVPRSGDEIDAKS